MVSKLELWSFQEAQLEAFKNMLSRFQFPNQQFNETKTYRELKKKSVISCDMSCDVKCVSPSAGAGQVILSFKEERIIAESRENYSVVHNIKYVKSDKYNQSHWDCDQV